MPGFRPDFERPLRVVQWGTGGIGARAIRAIHERPDLELVGGLVSSPAKAGRDLGELAGIAPIGVRATTRFEEVLELDPDCACYAARGEMREAECVEDFCRLLAAGIDVVTVSMVPLIWPAAAAPRAVARLEAACREGGSTIYASGIEPGFAADHLALTLATLARRVDTLRTQEIFSYGDYPVAFTMREVFGFGKDPDARVPMEDPRLQAATWGAPIRMVADALGLRLDGIRATYEKAPTPRRLEVAFGTIEAGSVGAVRFETIGVVEGRERIVVEHVNRLATDLAPEWPTARDGTYRVLLEGEPSLRCELQLGDERSFSDQGLVATTMRIVNAIPYVCAAPPGIADALSLPLTLPAADGGLRRAESRPPRRT